MKLGAYVVGKNRYDGMVPVPIPAYWFERLKQTDDAFLVVLLQPQVDEVARHHNGFHRNVAFDEPIDVIFINLDVLNLQANQQFDQVFLLFQPIQKIIT